MSNEQKIKYPDPIQKRLDNTAARRNALMESEGWPPPDYESGLQLMFILMGGWPAWEKLNQAPAETPSLPVEPEPLEMQLKFENSGDKLIVCCPDEDSDFTLSIRNKGGRYWVDYVLSIDDAEALARFLHRHSINEREATDESDRELLQLAQDAGMSQHDFDKQQKSQALPIEEVLPLSPELTDWVDEKARELMGGRDLHYGGFRDAAQWLAIRLALSQKECSRLIGQANEQYLELSSLREQLAEVRNDVAVYQQWHKEAKEQLEFERQLVKRQEETIRNLTEQIKAQP
jgi:hypothetical protein